MNDLSPILYAEDEENDAFFLGRAFQHAGVANPLVVVRDGQQAIDYCAAGHTVPCLVLLDLNMPKKSGLEVLSWIRKESPMPTLPIIVLTSSLQNADIHRAYAEGANAYLVKPSAPGELIPIAQAIKTFWLTYNRIDQGLRPAN
jgi:CheY-like chemotaxis protein